MLIDVKSTFRVGNTLVPFIIMSGGAHLSNFADDKRVACIYDNWQSIFEDPPDALNAQHRNVGSPADSNHEPQDSSEAAG